MPKTIIIDPGHGGFDPGAVFDNRREKDDNLRLALAVGQELQNAGYHIIYTRTDDRYDSPYDKAQIANNAGGDLFLSFHRNYAEQPDLYQGVQALVYDKNPLALRVSKNVNENLEALGFDNLGIEPRKELVVLRRTKMPAVLLEVGFINSAKDNQLFDEKFNEIATAIVSGVEQALPLTPGQDDPQPRMAPQNTNSTQSMPDNTGQSMGENMTMRDNNDRASRTMPASDEAQNRYQTENDMRLSLNQVVCELVPNRPQTPMPRLWYYVQVGLFRYPENAVYMMEQLKQQGYATVWKRVGGLIAIWVGPFETLDEAVAIQRELQQAGYETLVVTDDFVTRK